MKIHCTQSESMVRHFRSMFSTELFSLISVGNARFLPQARNFEFLAHMCSADSFGKRYLHLQQRLFQLQETEQRIVQSPALVEDSKIEMQSHLRSVGTAWHLVGLIRYHFSVHHLTNVPLTLAFVSSVCALFHCSGQLRMCCCQAEARTLMGSK